MKQLIDQKDFFEKYKIDADKFDKTTLKWEDLQKIYVDYFKEIPKLEASAVYLFNSLMKTMNVHSVRYRVKDAEHVIEKIIRNRIKEPEKIITIGNYKTELTDLIGLRALHLFKEDWYSIHELIISTWDLKKKPIANYREGDSLEYKKKFEECGCDIKEHPFGYRSVHYIVETKPAKKTYFAEIQVRTIFEEAWSEIDHSIRYPYDQNNPVFGQFLLILNRLAGSADEMGTFILYLKKELENKEESFKQALTQKDELINKLENKVKELKLKGPDLKFFTEGFEKLKHPVFKLEDFNSQNLISLDHFQPIEVPDFLKLKTFKTIEIPKVPKITISDREIPKSPETMFSETLKVKNQPKKIVTKNEEPPKTEK